MGKTYRSQSENDYYDDLFEDDMDLDVEFDESMELFQDRHGLTTSSNSSKGRRGRKNTTGYPDDFNQYRLPQDWQDFDYAPDSTLNDDWR